MKAFTVRDVKSEAFMQPFFARSKGEAMRSFSDEVNNPTQGLIGKHPSDFVLFMIGEVNYRDWETDRKSTRLNSSHSAKSRMPSSA